VPADKKGEEAAQDLTSDKGTRPKADADSLLGQHLASPGNAAAGRNPPEAPTAAQGHGQAGSASIHQADTQKIVSSARFTQQAGNAEMQVRLRSETLGPIDVHAVVKGSDIGASIRVEAREAQAMLTSELPQLERALNERSLRVQHLDVLQNSVAGGRSNGNGAGNSYGSLAEPRQGFSSYSAGPSYPSLPETPAASEEGGLGLSTTRINLRV
jgi:flagellar hook-length control protein FliK